MRHAGAAAEASDFFAALVDRAGDADLEPGELALTAARGIVFALRVRDWSVVAERAKGTDWAVLAERLRTPEEALRAMYEAPVEEWLSGPADAPGQPGAPGGMATVVGRAPTGLLGGIAWLTQWLQRRAAAASAAPLPPIKEPSPDATSSRRTA